MPLELPDRVLFHQLPIPGEIGRNEPDVGDGEADASNDGGGVSTVLVDEL
jgi:hypothetical protein